MSEVTTAPTPVKGERLVSVDALRGFDMFWIVGGRELVLAVVVLLNYPMGVPEWVKYHASHPEWLGFSAWDLIMPLFLFLAGVSIPFAFSRRLGESHDYKAIYRRMARRLVLLWIFGMIAQGNLLEFDIDRLRLFSNTLQSIAVGYAVAAVAVLHFSVIRQVVLTAAVLIAYWLLMMFVPGPGMAAGQLEPHANLALWLDKTLLGRFEDRSTYAWILPGLGFAGTVLLGVFGGHILRRKDWAPVRRAAVIAGLGIGCLAGGWLWGLHFPIIKHIWTSSMVLWAAGWSYLLLALFYLVIDIWGWKKWAFPFVIIGSNAILIYMVVHVLHVEEDTLAGLAPGWEPGVLGGLLVALGSMLILLLPLYVLYRRKIFLRV